MNNLHEHSPTPWHVCMDDARNVRTKGRQLIAFNHTCKSSTQHIGWMALHESDKAIAKAEGK